MVDSSGNCTTEESRTGSEKIAVSGSGGNHTSWISNFCSLSGNELLCEVDEEYIRQDFNLLGLSSRVSDYEEALDVILDVESSKGDEYTEKQKERIKSSAEELYGLIHARYILTTDGMASVLKKYENYDFGTCPRKFCEEQPCLPVGEHDKPGVSLVSVYCPKCEDIYEPWLFERAWNDGAWFGSTFPHLFLMTYEHLKPKVPTRSYVSKVFGFKLHKS